MKLPRLLLLFSDSGVNTKKKFNHDVPPQYRWHLMARCDGILAPMRACIISIAGLPSVSIARHDRRIEILIGGFLEKRRTRRTVQRFSSGSSALHTNAYMHSALFRDRSSWPTGRPRLPPMNTEKNHS